MLVCNEDTLMAMATKKSDHVLSRLNTARRGIGALHPAVTPKPKQRPMQKGRVHRAKSRA
jgi:hypothetical protein